VYFDFLYKFCLKYFSFFEELREIWSKRDIGLHIKYPLLLFDFNFLYRFSKNAQISNSTKIRSSGSRVVPCGQTEGRTDITRLKVDFRNFVNRPKNWGIKCRCMFAHVTVRQRRNHYRHVNLHITTSYKHNTGVSWANQIKHLAVILDSKLTCILQYQQDIV
jgi:hypothetical protein